jgi:hypothetical protein
MAGKAIAPEFIFLAGCFGLFYRKIYISIASYTPCPVNI